MQELLDDDPQLLEDDDNDDDVEEDDDIDGGEDSDYGHKVPAKPRKGPAEKKKKVGSREKNGGGVDFCRFLLRNWRTF